MLPGGRACMQVAHELGRVCGLSRSLLFFIVPEVGSSLDFYNIVSVRLLVLFYS